VKAIITEKYGDVDVLGQQEVEKPAIKEDEILVRVHAFSINPVDWKIRRGDLKLLVGRRPPRVLGGDYSGAVAEVGKQITNFKIGDEVFGMVNAFKGGTYGFTSLGLVDSLSIVSLQGSTAARGSCADQWLLWRGRAFRAANRQNPGEQGDRRVQHQEFGIGEKNGG
jgi:NADPH:quinone reductase-like Zn-dependent oxidoreductase